MTAFHDLRRACIVHGRDDTNIIARPDSSAEIVSAIMEIPALLGEDGSRSLPDEHIATGLHRYQALKPAARGNTFHASFRPIYARPDRAAASASWHGDSSDE